MVPTTRTSRVRFGSSLLGIAPFRGTNKNKNKSHQAFDTQRKKNPEVGILSKKGLSLLRASFRPVCPAGICLAAAPSAVQL